MKYVVVYEQTPHNWAAYVPDLPGCIATAATRDETRDRMREAIVMHLESLQEFDEPVPEPGTWTEEIDVKLPTRRVAQRS